MSRQIMLTTMHALVPVLFTLKWNELIWFELLIQIKININSTQSHYTFTWDKIL